MFGGSTPAALAARFTAVAQNWVADGPAERAERARRKLLAAIGEQRAGDAQRRSPKRVGRGAPAVSRSVDAWSAPAWSSATQDPNNRRRLALRLTEAGRDAARPARRRRPALRSRQARPARAQRAARDRTRDRNPRTRLQASALAVAAAGFPALLGGGAAAATSGPEPSFLPPLSCLLTVAQARLSASFLETPRFS